MLRLDDDAPLPDRPTIALCLGYGLAATGRLQQWDTDQYRLPLRSSLPAVHRQRSTLATAVAELCRQGATVAAAAASDDVSVQQIIFTPLRNKEPGCIAATVTGFELNEQQVGVLLAGTTAAALRADVYLHLQWSHDADGLLTVEASGRRCSMLCARRRVSGSSWTSVLYASPTMRCSALPAATPRDGASVVGPVSNLALLHRLQLHGGSH